MNCLFNLPENLKYKLKTRIILKTVLKLIVISLVVGYGGSGELFFLSLLIMLSLEVRVGFDHTDIGC